MKSIIKLKALKMEKLKEIKHNIDLDFPKKCRKFDLGCYECRIHMAYQILEDYVKYTPPRLKK